MSVQPLQRWTPAGYLAFERNHTDKHEFVDGQIVRQAGGSQRHALIGTNVTSSLHQQLRLRACMVYGSDMRVVIPLIVHAKAGGTAAEPVLAYLQSLL